MTAAPASSEVAVEALWRCVRIHDRAARRAAVAAVLDEHGPSIQAYFAALGDDLTTHPKDWYVDHFAASLEEYVPKDLLKRIAETEQAQVNLLNARIHRATVDAVDEQRKAWIEATTPASRRNGATITSPRPNWRRRDGPPSVPAAATAEGKAAGKGEALDHQVDGQREQGEKAAPLAPKTAAEFLSRLEETVVGQPRACKAVALAMVDGTKGCTLLIGPSGSGKTLIAETAATMARRPFVVCDVSSLVPAGIVGESLSGVLTRLRRAAAAMGEDVRPETGVIVADECDKAFSRTGTSGSKFGPEVIAQLLRLLDGATVEGFATDKLTVILAGAWHNLHVDAGKTVTVEDLDLPAEVQGRIKRVARLNAHTAETLDGILRNAGITPWGTLLPRVADNAHAAVVAEALRLGTGARGLRYATTAVADHLAFLPADQSATPITAAVVAAALAAQ